MICFSNKKGRLVMNDKFTCLTADMVYYTRHGLSVMCL